MIFHGRPVAQHSFPSGPRPNALLVVHRIDQSPPIQSAHLQVFRVIKCKENIIIITLFRMWIFMF